MNETAHSETADLNSEEETLKASPDKFQFLGAFGTESEIPILDM